MSTIKMSGEIDHDRRRFCGTAAMTIAAAQAGIFAAVDARASQAEPAGATASKPSANTSFGPLKQIDAGVINGGVGHNLPQEAPQAFAKAIVDVDAFARP